MTVDDIATHLQAQGRQVSTATIYNSVRVLTERGLVERCRFDMGHSLFWLKPGLGTPDQRILCKSCQRSFAVEDPALAALIEQLCAREGVALGAPSIMVQVECADCAAAHKPLVRRPLLPRAAAHLARNA